MGPRAGESWSHEVRALFAAAATDHGVKGLATFYGVGRADTKLEGLQCTGERIAAISTAAVPSPVTRGMFVCRRREERPELKRRIAYRSVFAAGVANGYKIRAHGLSARRTAAHVPTRFASHSIYVPR